MEKSADAYRTISEVSEELKLPQHVLRFWETRFPQVKPMKRGGNRRFYKPGDVDLLRAIKALLYGDGYTIKGVQRILKEQGPRAVASLAQGRQLRPSMKPPASLADQDGQGIYAAVAATIQPTTDETSPRPSRPDATAPRPDRGLSGSPARAANEPRGPGLMPGSLRDRLEAIQFELSECERILAAARG